MKKALIALLFLSLVGLGYWRWQVQQAAVQPGPVATPSAPVATGGPAASAPPSAPGAATAPKGPVKGLAATLEEPASVMPPGNYNYKDNIVEIELSEYAGYAGLIYANGGLEPNENSYFFKTYGFKPKITLSEADNWSPLNTGKLAVTATTADVLAVYANQMQVAVPIQTSYSRGADSIVVRDYVKRLNDLKGRVLVASQFGESEFFLRYLAQEANLPVYNLKEGEKPKADSINLCYADDPFVAGDVFLSNLDNYAGFVGWEPKVSEVVGKAAGRAHVLVDNRNLLIIADILLVNKNFAQQHPEVVKGLVDGVLYGNDIVRNDPTKAYPVLKTAFKWDPDTAKANLAKVHLANYPENIAFFSGAADAAGSFSSIYQTSLYAYGNFVKHNVGPDRFINTQALESVKDRYAKQVAGIAPIRTTQNAGLEGSPLLSRNVKFLFDPNSFQLSDTPENAKYYTDIKRLLDVSPGSTVLLRGHVDNGQIEDFRKQGGDGLVRRMALSAVQLSRDRANAVKAKLIKDYGVGADRIEIVGRGWDEPIGTSDENRRVEVYWFTVE
jgi:NitT/TauT family transport system substrate-binding protein